MDILAIIQARSGSTRLPNKVLMKFCDKTVLEHVINRVRASKYISEVIIATTILKEDLEVVKICVSSNTRVFCGSVDDVLDRFYQIAKLLKPHHIVRITADCPLMDYKVIDKVISTHLETKSDYTANILEYTYPDGLDVEVFTYNTLKLAYQNANLSSEREHVTPYIRNHPEIFKLTNVKNNVNYFGKRWTLDNKEDYEFINIIYNALYKSDPLFGMEQVLEFLNKNPQLEDINKHINRNEGYEKSLKEDKVLNLEIEE